MECLDGQKKSAAEAYIEKKLKLFFPEVFARTSAYFKI
jgi:hypothetical protein